MRANDGSRSSRSDAKVHSAVCSTIFCGRKSAEEINFGKARFFENNIRFYREEEITAAPAWRRTALSAQDPANCPLRRPAAITTGARFYPADLGFREAKIKLRLRTFAERRR